MFLVALKSFRSFRISFVRFANSFVFVLIDFLVTKFYFEICNSYTPGDLTDLRSATVNNATFAVIGVRNNFHKYLKHSSSQLGDIINTFVRSQEENGHVIIDDVSFFLVVLRRILHFFFVYLPAVLFCRRIG